MQRWHTTAQPRACWIFAASTISWHTGQTSHYKHVCSAVHFTCRFVHTPSSLSLISHRLNTCLTFPSWAGIGGCASSAERFLCDRNSLFATSTVPPSLLPHQRCRSPPRWVTTWRRLLLARRRGSQAGTGTREESATDAHKPGRGLPLRCAARLLTTHCSTKTEHTLQGRQAAVSSASVPCSACPVLAPHSVSGDSRHATPL